MTETTQLQMEEFRTDPEYGWPLAGGLFALCAGAAMFAYGAAVAGLADVWWNSYEFGHGLLVVPIIVWTVWLDRHALVAMTPRIWLPALLAVAACAALWLLSSTVGVLVGEQTALMLMLPSLSLLLLGPRITRALTFQFTFPFVATPLWWLINPWLQDWTAWATTALVREMSIPIYREGNYLTIAYGRFLVAEVCSGLRFLLASISLCALFAFLNIRSFGRGLILVGAGLAMSMLTNWIRVTSLVSLGHFSKMQHPWIEDHIFLGWVLFAISMAPLMWFGNRLADGLPVGPPGEDEGRVVASSPWRWSSAVLVAVLLTAVGPYVSRPPAAAEIDRYGRSFGREVQEMAVPSGWTAGSVPGADHGARAQGADAHMTRSYQRDGAQVTLYLAGYAAQRQGAEVINDWNMPFDKAVFEHAPQNDLAAVARPLGGLEMDEYIIRPRGQAHEGTRLVWHAFRVAGRYSRGDLSTKVRQLEVLGGATERAFVLSVSTPMQRNADLARTTLEAFMKDFGQPLEGVMMALEAQP